MDQSHRRANLCQQQSILSRGIPTANYTNIFAGELLTIASCRFNDAATGEFIFSGNAEAAATQAGGNYDGDRLKLFTTFQNNAFRFQVSAFNLNVGP